MRVKSETAKLRSVETARTRSAFTLVEMIVVITIMLILTVLAVAVVPKFQDHDNVVRAGDLVSQWLITAKMRAGRDQVPTGVRFQTLAATSTTSTTAVAQPNVPTTVTPQNMSGVTTSGLPWSIQAYSTLVVTDGVNTEPVLVSPNPPPTSTSFTAVFKFPHPAGFIIRVLDYCQELQYIQQADDFIVTPGVNAQSPAIRRVSPGLWQWTGLNYQWLANVVVLEDPPSPTPNPPDFASGLDLTNPVLWPVQQGDYFEALGTGVVHYIQAVQAPPPPFQQGQFSLLQLGIPGTPPAGPPFAFPQPPTSPPTGAGTPPPFVLAPLTSQYRIIRAPRVLEGETPLDLPPNIVVDITYPKLYPNSLQFDPVLPVDSLTGNVDILFSPSGAVIGRNKGVDKIMLWVRDGTKDYGYGTWPPSGTPGDMYLVTIQVRTGFIAVHPVNISSQDPYAYARDDRSSGL